MAEPQAVPVSQESSGKLFCKKCKTKDLRRRTPSFGNRVTSFYPYVCGRCGAHASKFRFTLSTLLPLLFLGAIAAGISLFFLDSGALNFFQRGTAADSAQSAQQSQTEALARARTSVGGELSTFEQMMLRKPKATMDNATILKLVKASVGNSVILQMIHTSNADYDLSANAIIELKQGGVDQTIILAMIDAGYATR